VVAQTVKTLDDKVDDAEKSVEYVFRGDKRSPSEIFEDGFTAKGSNTDLLDHAANNPSNSAYISTSKSPNVSRGFAGEGGYVYTIKNPGGKDVNKTLGSGSPFPHEQEISIPYAIDPANIQGARQVGPNLDFIGPFIKNAKAQ